MEGISISNSTVALMHYFIISGGQLNLLFKPWKCPLKFNMVKIPEYRYRQSCVKSYRCPQVMSVESGLVGSKDYKFDDQNSWWPSFIVGNVGARFGEARLKK